VIHDEHSFVHHASRTYPPHLGVMYNEVCPPRRHLVTHLSGWILRLFIGACCALAGAQWGSAVRRERIFETVYRPDPELCEDVSGMWRRCPWASPRPSYPDVLP
jgi:hypothetical protein